MLRYVRLPDLRLGAAALNHLHVTVARLLIAVFYPKARGVNDIGDLFRVVG